MVRAADDYRPLNFDAYNAATPEQLRAKYPIPQGLGGEKPPGGEIVRTGQIGKYVITQYDNGVGPRTGQNFASGSGRSDAFGRRLALHGFVNGLLAGGENPKQVEAALPDLLKLEDAIDRALAVSEPRAIEPLPVIQQEEFDKSLGEDIPF